MKGRSAPARAGRGQQAASAVRRAELAHRDLCRRRAQALLGVLPATILSTATEIELRAALERYLAERRP